MNGADCLMLMGPSQTRSRIQTQTRRHGDLYTSKQVNWRALAGSPLQTTKLFHSYECFIYTQKGSLET